MAEFIHLRIDGDAKTYFGRQQISEQEQSWSPGGGCFLPVSPPVTVRGGCLAVNRVLTDNTVSRLWNRRVSRGSDFFTVGEG